MMWIGSYDLGGHSHSKKRKLVLECDELWSFVGSKAEQAWLWLLSNHIGAIWYFIHDYNARICARLEPITTC